MFTKKAITPIVATALLMTITVIAVIGFQDWFQNFSSTILTASEQKTQNTETLKIDKIINNNLYLNTNSNTTIQEISINGIICNKNINIENGIQNIDLSICLKDLKEGKHTILIKTNQGIKEKYFYKKNEEFADNSKEIITKSTSGLVGYWNFDDGTTKDVSENNNNGILHGDTKIINGKAILDGYDDYITISNPIIQDNLKQQWTVNAQIQIQRKNSQYLIYGINKGLHVVFGDRNQTLLYLNYGTDDYYTYGNIDLQDNKSHFVSFVFDNNKTYRKIYIDGEEIPYLDMTHNNNPSGILPELKIGIGLKGNIDEISIYNRSLTQLEVKELYLNNYIENTVKIYGAKFNGINSEIITNKKISDLFPSQKGTIEIEFKTPKIISNNYECLFSSSYSNEVISICQNHDDKTLFVGYKNLSSSARRLYSNVLEPNTYYKLKFTANGEIAKLELNDFQINRTDFTDITHRHTVYNFKIGNVGVGTNRFFTGEIYSIKTTDSENGITLNIPNIYKAYDTISNITYEKINLTQSIHYN